MGLEVCINPDLHIEAVARVCHEAVRAHHECYRGPGDNPIPAWEDAPDWQRESTIRGVRLALVSPSEGVSHREWFDERWEQGWRCGPERDEEKKLNPAMVDFEELPRWQQEKDRIIIVLARALLPEYVREPLVDSVP